jgi:signal transduction histidine kinase
MTADVREISATNLHRRLTRHGPDDELNDLGNTFNDLLGRLERSFEAQRQFVANASHELRTPLARQRTLIQVALDDRDVTVDSLRTTFERVLVAGGQQEKLVDALLTLARGERGLEHREPVDVAVVANDVLQMRRAEVEGSRLRLDTRLGAAPITGDPRLLERLVMNLVDNALRYNAAHGWIEVTTATKARSAVLRVTNSGSVVPPAQVDRLFQPFQRLGADRTRSGDGWGLGLSIVRAIASAHDAAVVVRARPEGGLDVEISFPSA